MPAKAKEDLQKHTLNLYKGDFEELCALFPDIKPSILVREIVRDCIVKHRGTTVREPIAAEVQL